MEAPLSVCLYVCPNANSSQASGPINFIFGGKVHLIPGKVLIYFSWPSRSWPSRWRSSKISKKIKVREICWNVGSIETSKTFFLYISQKTCKIYDILKQGRMLMEIVWVVCGGVAHKFSHLPLMLVTVSIPMLIPANITNRVDFGPIPNWRWRLRLDIGPMSIRVAVYAGSYQTQLLNVGLISIRYWFRRLDTDPTSSRVVLLAEVKCLSTKCG